MKLFKIAAVLMLFAGAAFGQELPDAPAPQKPEQAHFITYRSSWEAPALRPDKKSWALFAVTHAIAWSALATANHNKETWGSEAPALAAVTALDFAVLKLFNPLAANGGAIWGAQHYFRAR